MKLNITSEEIKRILPYSLNIIYSIYFSLGAIIMVANLMSYIFFEVSFLDISDLDFNIAMFFIFSLLVFLVCVGIAKRTKRSWLRFGCLYLSGQIYFVILLLFINTFTFGLTLTNLSFATIFIIFLFSAIKFANFIETLPHNFNEDKSVKSKILLLAKKLFPFTLNFLYIAFFILVLTNELTKIGRDPINVNETLHLSVIGIFLFTFAIFIAAIIKHKWVRFTSLYLSGQAYIVILVIYLVAIA